VIVELAFRVWYRQLLKNAAVVRYFPSSIFEELYQPVCFIKFVDDPSINVRVQTIKEAVEFLHGGGPDKSDNNSSTPVVFKEKKLRKFLESSKAGGGTHGTSHDPNTTDRLRSIIHKLDKTYYDNDIGWVESILPCQK